MKRQRDTDIQQQNSDQTLQEEIQTGKVGVTEQMAMNVEGLCKIGVNNKKIADFLGISTGTLNEWRKKFSNLDEAIRRGREGADIKVVQSLFDNATGYKMEVEEPHKNDDGTWTVIRYTKRYPPDTRAAIKWLTSRYPQQWSDSKKVDYSHTITTKNINEINMNGFTRSEKDTLFKALSQQVEDSGQQVKKDEE